MKGLIWQSKKLKTVNIIDNLTIEIDYDKLAKVIVNAEREVNTDNSTLSKILSALSAL